MGSTRAQKTDWHLPATIGSSVFRLVATYVYFLIFAEFALVEVAAEALGPDFPLRLLMGTLGVSGICGSIAAGISFRRQGHLKLRFAFLFSGLAAIACPYAASLAQWLLLAAVTGLSLGFMTVGQIPALPQTLGRRHLGWWVGLATGTAYAVCNLPFIFEAGSRMQSWFAGTLCIIAAMTPAPTSGQVASAEGAARNPGEAAEKPGLSLLGVVLLFLVLVWLDSAAFFIIQATPELQKETWGSALLAGNGATHFLWAIAAGWLCSRGNVITVIGVAFAALIAGIFMLRVPQLAAQAHWPYVAGVSFYSTALIFLPAAKHRRATRLKWAAWLYAVSGWAGSALGIGMAQDLGRIPTAFPLAAIVLFAVTLYWHRQRPARLPKVVQLAILSTLFLAIDPVASASEPITVSGREVYVSEGCIHCHSQYIRPNTLDTQMWGRPTEPEEARHSNQGAPLIGNRRQGPDLSTVGNRRSADWHRAHLIAPRALSPGSRMPAYPHLFAPGDQRGPALVAYLQSLTGDSEPLPTTAMIPPPESPAGSERFLRGKAAYFRYCSQCHGADASGNGEAAAMLMSPVRNLVTGPFIYPLDSSLETRQTAYRVIKYGIAGTSMPGHEYLPDEEIFALIDYVAHLRTTAQDHNENTDR